jgi:hypothetical protein
VHRSDVIELIGPVGPGFPLYKAIKLQLSPESRATLSSPGFTIMSELPLANNRPLDRPVNNLSDLYGFPTDEHEYNRLSTSLSCHPALSADV